MAPDGHGEHHGCRASAIYCGGRGIYRVGHVFHEQWSQHRGGACGAPWRDSIWRGVLCLILEEVPGHTEVLEEMINEDMFSMCVTGL